MDDSCKACEAFEKFKVMTEMGISEDTAFHTVILDAIEDIEEEFEELKEVFSELDNEELSEAIGVSQKFSLSEEDINEISYQNGFEDGYKTGVIDLTEIVDAYARNVE